MNLSGLFTFLTAAATDTASTNDYSSYFLALNIMVPAFLIYYGYKFWSKPPVYLKSDGFNTKKTRSNEAIWKDGQIILGQNCVFGGILVAIACAAKYFILMNINEGMADAFYYILEILVIALVYPLAMLRVRIKYGPAPKEPGKKK